MENLSTKRTRVSPEQRQKMLEFMLAHPDFARNRVAGADAARRKLKLQAELAAALNSCAVGATKSSEKWIKCWQDWRSDVKAIAAKIRRAQLQTGGGPGPAPLSSTEETLLAFIGVEAAEGLAVADTLEISDRAEDVEVDQMVDLEIQVDQPEAKSTSQKRKHFEDRLEKSMESQAAAMDQLSGSMNNLAAAINNLAIALNSVAFTSQQI